MGTFGTDLLASDSALDFIDSVAGLAELERHEAVKKVLRRVVDDASSLMREVLPEEVLTAAILVAASLPGAEDAWEKDRVLLEPALPVPSAVELTDLANRAVDIVVEPGSWWRQSWGSEADALTAMASVTDLQTVLRSG